VIAGALGFLAAVLYIAALRDIFRFAALHPNDLAICLGAGLLSFLLINWLGLKPRPGE